MATPHRTVADLVADLQALPQDLPVLVTCHYDNDDGLRKSPTARVETVSHSEAEFYYWSDPADPGSFSAVVVN